MPSGVSWIKNNLLLKSTPFATSLREKKMLVSNLGIEALEPSNNVVTRAYLIGLFIPSLLIHQGDKKLDLL